MNKIKIILILLMLTGCATEKKAEETEIYGTFKKIDYSLGAYIVYDTETKVEYAVSTGSYNYGNYTMLVNADGTPKLYLGETE